ncbi:MAG: AAA family ATPase [Planctomycetes bacterium]|nr:AAA family ATPase [Planctomycetota bacterium]
MSQYSEFQFCFDARNAADKAGTPEWLWHGLLAPGKLTLFTSLWKSGKTTLLAHLLAQRRPQLGDSGGEFLNLAVKPGVSLIVSEEPSDLWPMRRRRHQLGEEVGVLTRPFQGRPTLAQFEQLNAQILAAKKERGLDLVVFDSLTVFLPTNNENCADVVVGAMTPFLALAEAGLAVLLPHHPSKGEPALGQAARGSGVLQASVDIILEMRHPGGNPFTRRRKLSAWSRYEETPRQMLIERSEDGNSYKRLADLGDDFQDHWETVRIILKEAGAPMTQSEIHSAWLQGFVRPHIGTLSRWLGRAAELGLVFRMGNGTKSEPYRYALAEAGREVA